MSALDKRLKQLELINIDRITVFITCWSGSDGYNELGRVTFGDMVIERTAKESEDEFMDRAHGELEQKTNPSQKLIVAFAYCS